MADKLTDKSLTEKGVRDMAGPASGNKITYDDLVKGFGVRVTKAGAKAFILNYRTAGRERRYTIGSYPDWTVAAARDRAKELKREVDNGGDPMGDRHEQRAAPTIADLAQLYRDNHLPRKRPASRQNDELNLAKHIIPRLGRARVTEVRRTDVAALHRDMTKTAPIAANRCLALLSKMFAVAMAEEWRTDNPCKGIERNPENRRERFLTPAEIARLGDALAAHPEKVSANAIRLLLLTGARKGETLAAKWTEFDLEAGVWVKPSAHTKGKKSHRVPLSAPAMTLLSGMYGERDTTCPFVFPGQLSTKPGISGKREVLPLTTVRKAWLGVCKTAGLATKVQKLTPAGKPVKDAKGEPVLVLQSTVRVHDLRHTYASILASAGLSLPIIGALLGHTQAATTQRYSHLMDDPLRAATERVGAVVMGAGKAGADVVADAAGGVMASHVSFTGRLPEWMDAERCGLPFRNAAVMFSQADIHRMIEIENSHKFRRSLLREEKGRLVRVDEGTRLPHPNDYPQPSTRSKWWMDNDIHTPIVLRWLLRGELVAFGDPDRSGAWPEWIAPRQWMDLVCSSETPGIFEGGGRRYWNVRVLTAEDAKRQQAVAKRGDDRIKEAEPPKSQSKAGRRKPRQCEVDAWMIDAFRQAFEASQPPPKRDLQAFPDCRKAIGARDEQMRDAIKKVPEEHRRRPGDRDRQIG